MQCSLTDNFQYKQHKSQQQILYYDINFSGWSNALSFSHTQPEQKLWDGNSLSILANPTADININH